MGEETMQSSVLGEEKIFVSVRLRPLSPKEIAKNDVSDWECINDSTIIYRNTLSVSERSMYPNAYTFDRVFGPDHSTRQVYEEGAKEVALSVVSGINASVFAYGQTSSGKTYTMSGITEYAIADIYNYMEKHQDREYLLKFSAMEIYNESVRDLLSADTTPLRLLDDPERGTIVEKLTEETLRDWNHFQELLSVCEAQRQIGETALNETSSRSHQILRLIIESSAREFLGNDNSSILTATVNFVDLAGSERASQSLSAGARLKEGCHINRSLLTLGTVIRKLSKGRNGHIPFRDSKLTRILQSSLAGNARTSIICTMSPAHCHVEQSRNTLLFAYCAKEVTTNAQVNVVMSDKALVKHLQRELARLESELRSPGSTSVTSDTAALLREKDLQIEKLKNENTELTMQRDLFQSEVEDLRRLVEEYRSTTVQASEGIEYPKLRVRPTWEFENPMPYTPISVDPQCIEIGGRIFDASQYSDGHSRADSEEHTIRIPDFEVDSPQSDHSSELSIRIPMAANSMCSNEIAEYSDDNSEDFCKVVRCIEMEDEASKLNIDASTPKCVKVPQATRHTKSNTSPALQTEDTKDLTAIENGDQMQIQTGSPNWKENNRLDNVPYAYVFPSPEKPCQMLLEKEMSYSTSRTFKLTRSRSCNATFMGNVASDLLDDVQSNHSTPPKDSTRRPEDFQQEFHPLEYSIPKPLSRNHSENSRGTTTNDELEQPVAEMCTDEKRYSFEISTDGRNDSGELCVDEENHRSSTVTEIKEAVDLPEVAKSADDTEHVAAESMAVVTAKRNVRDVGLDPMQDDLESPRPLAFEFKRIQRDIIRLWAACNVSLVHRTYFYLLFKGDPADSIYMEVELRRMSFLRDTFDQGNHALEDGRAVNAASSLRDLRRERQMLSKQMQKKLSRLERENLFLSWGIGLATSNRSLQLAHRLWTNTEDDNHIAQSASIVAKLIGFAPSEHASKEMFSLNFAPRLSTGRKVNMFRKTVMFLL